MFVSFLLHQAYQAGFLSFSNLLLVEESEFDLDSCQRFSLSLSPSVSVSAGSSGVLFLLLLFVNCGEMRWCLSEFKVGWLVGWLVVNPFFPSLPPSTSSCPVVCPFQQQNQFFGMRSSLSKRKQARQGKAIRVFSQKNLMIFFPGLRGRRGDFLIDCLLLAPQPPVLLLVKPRATLAFFGGFANRIGSDRIGKDLLTCLHALLQ